MQIEYIITRKITYDFNEEKAKKYNFNLKKHTKEMKKIMSKLHNCYINEIQVKITKDGEDVTKCYLS